MKKIIMLILGVLLVSLVLVSANGDHQQAFEEGKQLVESKISCDELTNKQLESIGEYYMEQMHPGEAHEAMHEMMGIEEGTEYHEQVHVNMARMMYCGESGSMMGGSGGMMGMMPMMMNMMGGGNMMNSGGMMGNNIMGSSTGSSSWWLWNIILALFWIALLVALILLIILLYKKIMGKPMEDKSTLEILKRRYAEGEINKREYESMKKSLGD